MTLTTLGRRSGTADGTDPGAPAPAPAPAPAATSAGPTSDAPVRSTRSSRSSRSSRNADALAVASFVLGLVGLLVMNILLGPAAIVMAVIALARSTARRGRALLGLALGVADLVVLAFLVTGNGAVGWSFSG
ncbi:hypothetical protein AMK09_32835 [Streptomyces sp. CB02488]|uniref:hypothetical protein n=1 Tax=Streptomyces sp. CB02488 TaxID=1703920 RepID=UPI00093D6AED|nr:hypothetical protein [Streptomyces sp. CB02488]OKK10471.1 hypothetical protein AMK09_32835 [Streptomyces sp. CB02488]